MFYAAEPGLRQLEACHDVPSRENGSGERCHDNQIAEWTEDTPPEAARERNWEWVCELEPMCRLQKQVRLTDRWSFRFVGTSTDLR